MTDMFIPGDVIFPVLFVAVFGFVLFRWHGEMKRQKALLEHQALRRHGTVTGVELFSYPKLNFPFEKAQVTVCGETGNRKHPARSFFIAQFSSSQDCKIRIFKETAFMKAGKAFGMQDFFMNNSGFDKTFVIQGNDDLAARLFLSPPIQSKLLEWQKDSPSISISKGQLVFSVDRYFVTQQGYDDFIEAGLLFAKKVMK